MPYAPLKRASLGACRCSRVAKIQSNNASHRGIKFTHSRCKLFTPLTVGVIAKVYSPRYPRWLGECNPVTRGQATENSNGRICSIRFA